MVVEGREGRSPPRIFGFLSLYPCGLDGFSSDFRRRGNFLLCSGSASRAGPRRETVTASGNR